MKLLLTSKGITNDSIKHAFLKLLNKDISDSQIAFITTSAYFVNGDKSWFVDEMLSVRGLKPKIFELIEINHMSRERIITKMNNSDVLFFSGGHSAALMHAIDSKDLRDELKNFAQNNIYAGISASSHIVSKDLKMSTQAKNKKYAEEYGYDASSGLGWIDFYVRSHFKSKNFEHIDDKFINQKQKEINSTVYALDDNSALIYDNGKIEIISEGEYLIVE